MNNGAAQTVTARGINEDVSGLLALLRDWRGVSTGPCRDGSIPRPAHHHHNLGEMDNSGAVYFSSGIFTGPPIWQVAVSVSRADIFQVVFHLFRI